MALAISEFVDIDPSSEMSPLADWTPGNYLTVGDATVVDIPYPVCDPVKQVRGQVSAVPQELLFKPLQHRNPHGSLSRESVFLIVSCCVIAATALVLLAGVHF